MKKLISILAAVTALTVFGCAASEDADIGLTRGSMTETYTREPYLLELSYPSGEIDFGSTAEFVLRIEYPENESYILLPPDVDNIEKYSNTIITLINESSPVLDGNGTSVSIITFSVEAWMPGELVFPPLTVSFGEKLSTEQIVISVGSAFEGDEEPRGLLPLYIPDSKNFPVVSILTAVLAIVVLIAAVILIILLLRHRKKTSEEVRSVKTRYELIEDFRKTYVEAEENIDLRAAFKSFERIPGTLNVDQYQRLMDEARFSKNGIPTDEGRRVLTELYLQLTMEGLDEF